MQFKIVSSDSESIEESGVDAKDRIEKMVAENPVFLFMKGTPESPQCGFSSTEEGNIISFDDQKRKLELVIETSNKIWGE